MHRRFKISAILLAWLLATGSQWDCAQVFAWGRMIAGHARTMPLADAVRLTFTPGNECAVCVAVADAKQQQPDTAAAAAAKAPGKILLFCAPAAAFVFAVPEPAPPSPAATLAGMGTLRASPPVPPPRAA